MCSSNDIIPIQEWFPSINQLPVFIAGPCSAESEIQVLETAKKIASDSRIKIFRAGIWKPRTRPSTFEGVGKIGLEWLKKVKNETGLLTCVEIATPKHLEKCLEHPDSVDLVWIGARTTSNPFSVQELANALEGVDIPVMIKNPLNPDLALWIGAIERIAKAGVRKIAAIHRGFYPFETTTLRNVPKWEIPIELKISCPNLSIINDPSHIAGNTSYIPYIAQKAMDLNMDGLMIETHITPKKALSDKEQQLLPDELSQLLDQLVFWKTSNGADDFNNQLEQYREQINSIDYQLIELLAKRMAIVENIGYYKNENHISILQLRRWKDIIKTRCEFGENMGLSSVFIKEILQLVHKESVMRQSEIIDRNANAKQK